MLPLPVNPMVTGFFFNKRFYMKRGRGRLPAVTTSRAVHDFAMAPQAGIHRSVFNRTHGVKTTFNFGQIIPIMVDEILPGDIFHVDLTSFARLATPLVPVMDNMYLDVHFLLFPNVLS